MKKRPKTVKAMFSPAEEVGEFDAMVKDTVADWARGRVLQRAISCRKVLRCRKVMSKKRGEVEG